MPLDPFAWQFLFVCGVACTTPWERRLRIPGGPSAILSAIVLLQVSISLLLVVSRNEIPLIEKGSLGPLRLATFAAAVILARSLLPRDGVWSRAAWTTPIRLAGRHCLLLFCCGAFLSRIADSALRSLPDESAVELGVIVSVWTILIVVAGLRTQQIGVNAPERFSMPSGRSCSPTRLRRPGRACMRGAPGAE